MDDGGQRRALPARAWKTPGPDTLIEGPASNMIEIAQVTTFLRVRRLLAAGLVVALASFGCGESTVELPAVTTYPVHGKVVLADGATALTEGTVTLVPLDPETGRQAVGRIGADGTFSLNTTPTQEGAAAGDYRVSVLSAASTPTGYGGFGKPLVDARFGDEASSGLTVTVKAEANELPPLVLDPSKVPSAGILNPQDYARDRG